MSVYLVQYYLTVKSWENIIRYIKIISSILGDKEFGKEIYYYALSELRKLGKTNRNEDELINKNKIITEEDLIKALKHKLNPKLWK